MRRVGLTVLALVAALALTAQALASSGSGSHRGGRGKVDVRGTVQAVSGTEITVSGRSGKTVTCKLAGFAVPAEVVAGTAVRIRCARTSDGHVLRRLRVRGVRAHTGADEIEIKGLVSAIVPATASAPGSIEVTIPGLKLACSTPAGAVLPAGVAVGARVELECRDTGSGPALDKVKLEDDPDSVVVQGRIEAVTPAGATTVGSLKVRAGVTTVQCAIPAAMTLPGTIVVGAAARISCTVQAGALTLAAVAVAPAVPGGAVVTTDELEVKGAIGALVLPTATAPGSITVAGISCAVPAGSGLVAGFALGERVEIKCETVGKDWTLVRIHSEDDDEDGDSHRRRGGDDDGDGDHDGDDDRSGRGGGDRSGSDDDDDDEGNSGRNSGPGHGDDD